VNLTTVRQRSPTLHSVNKRPDERPALLNGGEAALTVATRHRPNGA